MKKVLCYGPRDLRIIDLPEREPGPGEVKARMLITTINRANARLYDRLWLPEFRYPTTLSYTGVGLVEAVGPGVTGLQSGDHVYPNLYRACGECEMCRADRMVACVHLPETGYNMMVGEQYESGLQEYVILPERRLWRTPAHVAIESATMVGLLAVAMHAVTFLDPEPGDTVFIAGAGPTGWGIVQHAKLRGARVVISDIRPERLEQARQFGADVALDASQPNLREAIVEACGRPPLFVAEATGTPEGSQTAFAVTGRGARVAVVGDTNNPVSQHFLILKGLTVRGTGGGIKFQRVIDLIANGKLDLQQAISHRYPIERVKDAFETMLTDPNAMQVAVDLMPWG